MRFRQFYLLTEADPMGGMGGGAPPMGGPPGGAPPMGGGMGGDPMGGGMGAPPGGGGGAGAQPTIPQHADVWDVLDAILNHKPLPEENKDQQGGQDGQPPMGGPPPMWRRTATYGRWNGCPTSNGRTTGRITSHDVSFL
jgi:hypothetical protein